MAWRTIAAEYAARVATQRAAEQQRVGPTGTAAPAPAPAVLAPSVYGPAWAPSGGSGLSASWAAPAPSYGGGGGSYGAGGGEVVIVDEQRGGLQLDGRTLLVLGVVLLLLLRK